MHVIGVEKTRKLKHLSKDVMEIERENRSFRADKTQNPQIRQKKIKCMHNSFKTLCDTA